MSPSCGAKGSRAGAEAAVDTNSSSSSGKATAAMAERACAARASSAGVEMRDWVLTSLSEAAWEGGGCGERGGQVNSHPGRGHLDTHGRASLHGLGPADQGIPRRAWPDSRVTTQEQPGQETGSLTKELKKKKWGRARRR